MPGRQELTFAEMPSPRKLNNKQVALAVVPTAAKAAWVALPPYLPKRAVWIVTASGAATALAKTNWIYDEACQEGALVYMLACAQYRSEAALAQQCEKCSETRHPRWPSKHYVHCGETKGARSAGRCHMDASKQPDTDKEPSVLCKRHIANIKKRHNTPES